MTRVGIRCDVGPRQGVGHVMRCLALAEELARRGAQVTYVCDGDDLPWAKEQIVSRGFALEPAVWSASEHLDLVARLALDVALFDSYELAADVITAVRRSGLPTAAMVDGDLRGIEADLYIDQNLGSEHDRPALPEGAVRLAGLDYVLLRDEVLAQRPQRRPAADEAGRDVPEVLAFFGGSDAFGAGPHVVAAMAATKAPFVATVISPKPELAAAIEAVVLADGQRVTVIGQTTRLAEAAVRADLVLSASGSSAWELLCLGAPTGLVCVADNQVIGYERSIATGATVGLGRLSELAADPTSATPALTALLTDPSERARLAGAGWQLIDGLGRSRVADAFLGLTS